MASGSSLIQLLARNRELAGALGKFMPGQNALPGTNQPRPYSQNPPPLPKKSFAKQNRGKANTK